MSDFTLRLEKKKTVHSIFRFKKHNYIKHMANAWERKYKISDKYTFGLKILIKSTIKMHHYDFTGQCVQLVTF